MTNIGGLFKELNNNKLFNNYVEQIRLDTENKNNIINDMLNNIDFMDNLHVYVEDDNIIREKLIIVIGQKLKKSSVVKPSEDVVIEKSEDVVIEQSEDDFDEQSEDDKQKEFIRNFQSSVIIINKEKAVWLTPTTLLDPPIDIRIDPRMRLVTPDYEMFY